MRTPRACRRRVRARRGTHISRSTIASPANTRRFSGWFIWAGLPQPASAGRRDRRPARPGPGRERRWRRSPRAGRPRRRGMRPHRAGHGRDRVAVAAEGGREQARLPRVGGHGGQHRERGRARTPAWPGWCRPACRSARRPAAGSRPATRPGRPFDAGGDVGPGHPVAAAGRDPRGVAANAVAWPCPAPDTPALTAAATAAAPASAMPVSWVTRLAASTWSTERPTERAGPLGAGEAAACPGRSRFTAMPTGAMRIAAPLVVPEAPAFSGGVPARTAATARLVEGPRRSSEPRSAMSRSQLTRASASSRGSIVPCPPTRSLPSRTACSVSSVTAPAGRPAAIGWPGGAGSKPVRSPPQRSAISGRDSICVGMPSASPMASPYRAPRAREVVFIRDHVPSAPWAAPGGGLPDAGRWAVVPRKSCVTTAHRTSKRDAPYRVPNAALGTDGVADPDWRSPSAARGVAGLALGAGYRTWLPYISPRGSARSSRRAPSGSRKYSDVPLSSW